MSTEDHDPEQAAVKRKETDNQRKKRLAADVSAVLASSSGRAVIAEILSFCQVDSLNCFDGPAAFRTEGARAVGLRTMKMLRLADSAAFMKLYTELYCNDR
jgi:hypothetical protein